MTFDEIGSREQARRPRELAAEAGVHGWTWQAVGAVFGLTGGVVAVFFGAITMAIAWVTGSVEGYGLFLYRFSTVLLILTIPLLALGAHCLDLQDRAAERDAKREETQK